MQLHVQFVDALHGFPKAGNMESLEDTGKQKACSSHYSAILMYVTKMKHLKQECTAVKDRNIRSVNEENHCPEFDSAKKKLYSLMMLSLLPCCDKASWALVRATLVPASPSLLVKREKQPTTIIASDDVISE